jgi:hypothetical protein
MADSPSYSSHKLSQASILSGGVALLILVAVGIGGGGYGSFGLGAAAVTSQQTFGASTLTLTAASDSLLPGDSTTITWNATNITDTPNPTFCFTDGKACNAALQTLPAGARGTVQYSIGGVNYLLSYPGSQGSSNAAVYKWSGSCWGDAGGVCGNVLQALPVPYASGQYFVAPDGNSYVAFSGASASPTSNVIYKWSGSCWGDGYNCEDANVSATPIYYFQKPALWSPNGYGISTATIGSNFYLFDAQNGGTDFSRLFKWMAKPTVQQTTPPSSYGLNGYTLIEKTWALDPGRTVTSIGVNVQTAGATNVKVKIVKWNPSANTYDVVVNQPCPTTVVGWNDCTLATPYTVPTSGVYYAGAYDGTVNAGSASYAGSQRVYAPNTDVNGSGQTIAGSDTSGEAIRVTYQSGGNYYCFGTGGSCNGAYQNFAMPQGGGYYAAGGGQLFSIGTNSYLLTGDWNNAAPHLFTWMTSNVVSNSPSTPANSGYAGLTMIDRTLPLVPGATVTKIGSYQPTAQASGYKIKIVRRDGKGSYTVVYDQAGTTGTGWVDTTLTTPYTVPATGEYYAGFFVSSTVNIGYNASGGARAWVSGNLAINIGTNSASEDQSSFGAATRVTYSSPVGCFGNGATCGASLQTFPNTSSITGQSLTNDTGGWKVFTSGTDTFAGLANDTNSFIFKWNAASNCFGSVSGTCGQPFQEIPAFSSGSGSNWGDGWSFFTYLGTTYGMLNNFNGVTSVPSSAVYRWMNVSMQKAYSGAVTPALAGYTSAYLLLQLVNGATVNKIGVFYGGAAASMKIKIIKRNSAGNYDVVYDQAFTHPGTGWYDVTLTTPYTVPASGDYFPAVYGAVNYGTFPTTGYNGTYTARAIKSADALGTAQAFTESNGNQAPELRVTYSTNAVWCLGDGVSLCSVAYIAPTAPTFTYGLTYFNINSTPYIAAAGYTPATFKFASIPCFGSSVKCTTSASPQSLQAFPTLQATDDWDSFIANGSVYLLEANALSGGSSNVFKFMPGSSCLGDGTTCGAAVQSIAQNFSYFKTVTASDGTIYVAGGGSPQEGGTASASTIVYKWMPASNCLGDGTTCGTALQTFAGTAQNFKLYNITSGGTTSTYLAILFGPGNSQSKTYKLNPAGAGGKGCFGDAGGVCGNIYQTVSGDAFEWNTTTIGSNTYLLDINRKNRSYIYKWTPSGGNCPAGGGWGNGTSCDTGTVGAGDCGQNSSVNFQLIGGFGGSSCDTHHTTGVFFTVGTNTFLSIGSDGGNNEFFGTAIWMPNANGGLGCFGDGISTCGSAYSPDVRVNANGKDNVFASNGNTYLAVPITNAGTINIYKWTPSGAGCASNGGWGNGAVCGSGNTFQVLPSTSGNNELLPFTSGYIYGASAGNYPYLYQFIDNPSPDLGCTVTWADTSGNSGLLATGDSNLSPGVSTGSLFATTTYSLACPGAGAVSVTVGVKTTPSNLQISANPATLNFGSTTVISWSAAGVFTNSCGVTQTDPNNVVSSFSNIAAGDTRSINFTPPLNGTYSYKLSCVTPYYSGNNGSIINSLSSVAGKLAQALSLSNTNSNTTVLDNYIDIANTPMLQNLQNGNYTISAWFKPANDPPGTLGGTAAYSDTNNDNAYGVVIRTGWHTGLYYSHGGYFSMAHWLAGDVYKDACCGTSHPPGQWYNVVGVVDKGAGTVKLYVNGVSDDWAGDPDSSFTPGAAARDYGTTDWKIGIAGPGFSTYRWAANGVIDDVRFYNRALSADEVQTLANLGQVTSGLVAYYSLDSTGISGATVYDQAGGIAANSTNISVTVANPPTLTGCTTGIGTPSGCSLYVNPLRVRTGGSAQVSWNVTGLAAGMTCSITSNPSVGGLPINWNGVGSTWSGGPTSIGPISKQTTVTLSCSATNGTSAIQKTISLTPSFQEI